MSRTSLMTWGLLLILIGVQLNFIESYILTPRATNFWNTRFGGGQFETVPGDYLANGYFSGTGNANAYGNRTAYPTRLAGTTNNRFPYTTPNYRRSRSGAIPAGGVPAWQSSWRNRTPVAAAIGPQKVVTPPSWFCWPPIFLGAVLFLFGAASPD